MKLPLVLIFCYVLILLLTWRFLGLQSALFGLYLGFCMFVWVMAEAYVGKWPGFVIVVILILFFPLFKRLSS
jgi:hypothetical protein